MKNWPSDRIGMAAKAKQEPCLWVDYDIGGYWVGTCGVEWGYADGSPRENKMQFCFGCGKRLNQKGGRAK